MAAGRCGTTVLTCDVPDRHAVTSPEPLPPAVTAFLDEHIFSVAQLEVLLLLHEAGGGVMTARQLAELSYLPVGSILPWLEALTARGLLEAGEGGYRCVPREPDLAEALSQVADCYARRRVTLTRHVYTSKEDPISRFSDAFLFRKDRDR